jgi:hypothetical protein
MRKLAILSFVLSATLISTGAQAQTAFSVAAHIGDFHVAVSNYYHVPQREVILVRERRIRDDELPVVFFIAQRARVAPATIVDLRLRGLSWWDISVHYGIGPEVYYVPVAVAPGPPYGKAWGHYKKKHKKNWNTIVLSDDDVVNLVQVRFISDHYHIAPERVIESRGKHRDYVGVHQEASGRNRAAGSASAQQIAQNQNGKSQGNGNSQSSGNSQGNGKGKGKGKGKND